MTKEHVLSIIKKEPNCVFWRRNGVNCFILRQNPGLHLCGYIGVPKDHPLFGVHYNDIEGDTTSHGGLTFSGLYERIFPDADTWWIGFDCAHSGDYAPGYGTGDFDLFREGTYRNLGYVMGCVNAMADELASWHVEKREE